MPFWKGESVGRPYELGEAIGRTARELVALDDEAAAERLRADHSLDELAAKNLMVFLREQEAATGVVPSDRSIVVERFRDEIGDWRVCVLTPFGARVHAPWSLALAARLRESLGLEVGSIWSDDGIALHLPDADSPPPIEDLVIEPRELEALVLAELGQTALFGARFRENAGRALLIPRRRPGERTPLWQQRLKAQALLQVARRYPDFPVILETVRECLQDVFDLPALRKLLGDLQARRVDLVSVETASASPYASSLLFDYVATYMYEDDTPLAERRAQALALDRDLIRELLGQEELRDLLDADAVAEVEEELRGDPKTPDGLHDHLLRRGDLLPGSYDEALAEPLLAERRAVTVRVAGEDRLIAAEDAGRYRDALGAMPPAGLPDAFLESGEDPLGFLLVRFARGRGPFTTAEAVARFGPNAEEGLAQLEAEDRLVRGELRPGGTEREWCDPDVLRRLRRASLARLRRQVEPAGREALARFLPAWQGLDRRASLREALVPLQGLSLPASLWESDVLPRRVPNYQAAQLDQLCASGEVVWVGAGLERVAIYFREDAPALGRPGALPPPEDPAHEAIRSALGRGALFWYDLLTETGLEAETALPALWDLVWAGEVSNDAWTPLRASRRFETPRPERRQRRFSRSRANAITATQGRWSATAPLFAGDPDPRALAELLLERQGIVTRDGVRAEGVPGGYSRVYQELRKLETLGVCRRGYFVEGLGGAQFALPGAVERLREEADPDTALVLAAADPAQPYGAAIPWPKRADGRAARVAGALVVTLGGEEALFVERGGRSLVPLRDPEDEWLRPALAALVAHARRTGVKRLAVERFDSEPVAESSVMALLLEAGFVAGPRRAVLRPSRARGRRAPPRGQAAPAARRGCGRSRVAESAGAAPRGRRADRRPAPRARRGGRQEPAPHLRREPRPAQPPADEGTLGRPAGGPADLEGAVARPARTRAPGGALARAGARADPRAGARRSPARPRRHARSARSRRDARPVPQDRPGPRARRRPPRPASRRRDREQVEGRGAPPRTALALASSARRRRRRPAARARGDERRDARPQAADGLPRRRPSVSGLRDDRGVVAAGRRRAARLLVPEVPAGAAGYGTPMSVSQVEAVSVLVPPLQRSAPAPPRIVSAPASP